MNLLRQGLAKLLMGIGILLMAVAVKLDETVVYEFMKERGK